MFCMLLRKHLTGARILDLIQPERERMLILELETRDELERLLAEWARAVIAAMGKGEIAYRDFPEVLKGKYQNYTQADRTHLEEAGYDQGFHKMEDAVKEYVDFLDNGGYFTYGE